MDNTGLVGDSPLGVSSARQQCEQGQQTEELEEVENLEQQTSGKEGESDEQSAEGIEMKVRFVLFTLYQIHLAGWIHCKFCTVIYDNFVRRPNKTWKVPIPSNVALVSTQFRYRILGRLLLVVLAYLCELERNGISEHAFCSQG